jgi:hypothetical protein
MYKCAYVHYIDNIYIKMGIQFCTLIFETGSNYIAQSGLEFAVFLPQPPECWDYSHDPPYPDYILFF